MITNNGKDVITEFFSGEVSRIANLLVLGSGTTDPDLTDTTLEAQTASANITSISADKVNGRIVFKAVFAPGAVGTFTEIGLLNGIADTARLVAREVVDPKTLDANLPTEVEYSLKVTVS